MYTIFEPAWLTWRNRTVRATLQTQVPPLSDIEPHWWMAQPTQTPLPKMTFAVDKRTPLLDNYLTDRSLDLYSEKLVDVISQAGIQFETFPANLVDFKTGENMPVNYYVFHLLEIYPCADMQASKEGLLVLTETCLQSGRLFFRLAEGIQIVLIHRGLQEKFEKAKVSGCQYRPLNYRKIALRDPNRTTS